MDLRHTLTAQLDLWLSRFECFVATTPEGLAGCAAVLEEERRHGSAGAAVQGAPGGDDAGSRVAACRDTRTGRIVGVLRVTPALGAREHPDAVAEYRLDQFDDDLLARTVILSGLCVRHEYRGTVASLVLISRTFALLLDEGFVAALLTCEPSQFAMYRTFGARPIGRVYHSPSGGHRIPMLGIPDVAHLRAVGSPVLQVLGGIAPERVAPFTRWYTEFVAREGDISVGIAPYHCDPYGDADGACHQLLTHGLSTSGTERLLSQAVVVAGDVGDVVLAERDGLAIGFVREGLVTVQAGERTLAMLGPGEMFGELSYVLDGTRPAEIRVAVPGTVLLILPVSAIDRLDDPVDQIVLWRNLARGLAQQLIAQSPSLALSHSL